MTKIKETKERATVYIYTTTRIPERVFRELMEEARARGVSKSKLVAEFIERALLPK
ncbi:MAG: hypothetical protein Q4C70_08565 [Planctomycetia bacterium]|nr:hypothetical protein [Planctomycetia bacterium]